LNGENHILKWNAMLTLANLARCDGEKKLDQIMDAYLGLISGPVMVDAANAISGGAIIGRAKPYLADKIARCILGVEHASFATPECRNVAIGHAINALEKLSPLILDKRAIEAFVRRQMSNPRAATRDKAQKFCKKAFASSQHGKRAV
jgi:hypothetical protein